MITGEINAGVVALSESLRLIAAERPQRAGDILTTGHHTSGKEMCTLLEVIKLCCPKQPREYTPGATDIYGGRRQWVLPTGQLKLNRPEA